MSYDSDSLFRNSGAVKPIFDMSSMSNFMVEGSDAESMLNQLSGNNVAVDVGRCVYTQWMNVAGGVEADVTITRLADHQWRIAEG